MGNAGHVVQKASTNSMAQQVGNHFVLKTPLKGPFPEGHKRCVFATGCFWGNIFPPNLLELTKQLQGPRKDFGDFQESTPVQFVTLVEKFKIQLILTYAVDKQVSHNNSLLSNICTSSRSISSCSLFPGHTEGVFVIYDPKVISFSDLLIQFWMCHNPTQGNRQGHDTGTQYR